MCVQSQGTSCATKSAFRPIFLRNLWYDVIQSNLRCLQAMGAATPEQDDNSAILGSFVFSRLPLPWRNEWSEKLETDEVLVFKLLDWLENKIQARELASSSSCSHSSSASKRRIGSSPGFTPTSTLHTSTLPSPGKRSLCPFDEKDHNPRDCPAGKRLPADEVHRLIKRSGRCFRCFGLFHSSRNCQERISCTRCEGRHLVQLCKNSSSRGKEVK